MNIICTTAAEHIGKKLATDYGFYVIFPEKNREDKRYFPDGEVYARIPGIDNIKGETVIIHCGAPDPNSGLIELELILEVLRFSKIKPRVFFTYFPYGKQDKIFMEGETNAAENLIKKLINYYGVELIYTIDSHFSTREWVSKYPIINISAVNLLMQAALRDYPDLIFLSPDEGGEKRTGVEGMKKTRIDSFTTEIQNDEEFKRIVKGKRIGVIDDLLETGGTLARFSEECIDCGALELVALVTHVVLPEGKEKIQSKYSKLYFTNTINREGANADITAIIANTLLKEK